MKKFFITFSILCIGIFFLSACGAKEVLPVAIDEKNDTCAQCHMAVLDDQFATQVVLENGKTHTFDDIGCMFKWVEENPDEKIAAQFVRDYETEKWIKVEDATYVYEKSIKTPMAYNVVTFSEEQKAKEFAADLGANVMTSKEIEDHSWGMNKEMMMKMKADKGDTMEHTHDGEGEMEAVPAKGDHMEFDHEEEDSMGHSHK